MWLFDVASQLLCKNFKKPLDIQHMLEKRCTPYAIDC